MTHHNTVFIIQTFTNHNPILTFFFRLRRSHLQFQFQFQPNPISISLTKTKPSTSWSWQLQAPDLLTPHSNTQSQSLTTTHRSSLQTGRRRLLLLTSSPPRPGAGGSSLPPPLPGPAPPPGSSRLAAWRRRCAPPPAVSPGAASALRAPQSSPTGDGRRAPPARCRSGPAPRSSLPLLPATRRRLLALPQSGGPPGAAPPPARCSSPLPGSPAVPHCRRRRLAGRLEWRFGDFEFLRLGIWGNWGEVETMR